VNRTTTTTTTTAMARARAKARATWNTGGPRRWLRAALLVATLPALMGTECEEPLVEDAGFDVWCGDMLCKWRLDAGAIAKVPTWHARDYGVELVGPSVQISQLLTFGSDEVSCLHFNLLGDIDETANVVLDVDFDDDGTPEYMETISAGAWTPVSLRLTAPTYFHGLSLTLRKSGSGRAALAQLQAAKSSDCNGAPPFTPDRPADAACETAAECASGTCLPGGPVSVCAADGTICSTDADCIPTSADNSCTPLGVAGGRCQ
jgi:hypothetical protein